MSFQKHLRLTAAAAFAAGPLFLAGCSDGVDHERAAALEQRGAELEDASISARVASAIIEEADLKDSEIHVDTYDHVVRLYGYVHSRAQAELAERVAESVPHVARVKNVLVVD
jgi:osmotically-inducible protein OsmY